MSDRCRSRRHSRDPGKRHSRLRDRTQTPESDLQRELQVMRARLEVLENQASFAQPNCSRKQRVLPHESPRSERGASPPPARRQTTPPTRRHVERVVSPLLGRAARAPRSRTPPLPSAPPSMLRTGHTADSLLEHGAVSDITATDRIVDAIRSINNRVRSDQHIFISSFDPSFNNISDWCDEVDRAKLLNNWSDHECLSRIGNCLKGDARTWLREWVTSDRTWSNFKKEFTPLCPKTPDIANILFDVMSTNSDNYSTYADYARRSLLRLRIVRGLSDELISAIVVRGIVDPHIRASATNAKLLPNDIVEFLSIYVKPSISKTQSLRSTSQNNSVKSNHASNVTRKRRLEEGRCFSCGVVGHKQAACNKKAKIDSRLQGESLNPGGSNNSASKPVFVPLKSEPCSFCKKPGHKVDNCFAKQKSETRNKNNVNLCLENKTIPNNDVVVAVIQGIPLDVLIDSGSTISLMSSSLLKHFNCAHKPAFRVLRGLGSQEIESTSYVTLPIEFDGLTLEVDLFVVAPEYMNTPIIVGTDVLNREGVRYIRTRNFQSLTRKVDSAADVMTVQYDEPIPINTPLVGDQLKRLLNMINEFSAYFITGTATSTVNTGCMTIRLSNNTPVNYRPYRMSHAEVLRVREIIKDLTAKSIIRESESDYASPILLVKKKDGSDRMCVDFRKLNEVTVKDRFPLPRIDDYIDRLGRNKYFTSLDMATGFHQIVLHEESVPLTGFVTPEGHFEYLKMPYGLANAPVVYQRIISKTLRKFIDSGDVLVYIDDVLLLSQKIDQGFDLLYQVLRALTESGFSVNLKKCSFLTTEIEYLGRRISQGQVRPSPSKIKALIDSPEPKNVRQVRQFLGLASYFRRYIPSFAQRVACIAGLTKKGIEFSWGKEHQAARKEIVECLTNEPVLATYDPSLPIEVHTDASSIGYGAVLFQVHDSSHKRVVAYFSRLTQGAENRYHSYELETLAVVKALQHFRPYLVGVRFTVVTDCNALKLTQRKRDLLPRVARWWVYLQDFDFGLEYRKGTLMSHADYLSRNPVNLCTIQKPLNWARIAQAADDETQGLIQKLNDGQLDATRYTVKNDVLYVKYSPTGGSSRFLCYIPKGHRLSLLRVFHDEHNHVGVYKTVDLITNHFWFPGLRSFVLKYISHCLVCIAHKKVARAPFQLPFETIHMDALGPLPEADGYRHVLIVIDAFSKFCLLYPMYRQDANELKQHFNNVISLFGTPKLIVADRGRMFQSAEFLNWVKSMGCDAHFITPEMHQSNGQVERYCRTVLNMIRVETNYRQNAWPTIIWKIQLVLNITKHRTTQCSALNLLAGIEAATPLIRSLVRDVAFEGSSPNRESLREMSRQRAAERLRQNQHQQDAYVNQGRKPPRAFELNGLVFVRKQAQSIGKLDSCMRGPYRIVKTLPQGRYELQLLAGSYGKYTQAAAEYMVPWRGEWTPEVCAAYFDDADHEDEESTLATAELNSPADQSVSQPQSSTSGTQAKPSRYLVEPEPLQLQVEPEPPQLQVEPEPPQLQVEPEPLQLHVEPEPLQLLVEPEGLPADVGPSKPVLETDH